LTATDDDWFERERSHRAAEDGDLQEVQRLVSSGVPVGAFDDMNRTPLHYAAEREHYKVQGVYQLPKNASVELGLVASVHG